MKRHFLDKVPELGAEAENNMPECIAEYMAELKLLYYVPLFCLIPDEKLLPNESIRFFCVDETYTEVLVDGALSIGRNDTGIARQSERLFAPMLEAAVGCGRKIRLQKVHENHRGSVKAGGFGLQEAVQSGCIMRSALVSRRKGIEIKGLDGERELTLLRCDAVCPDILICIFDGELKEIQLSEPKSALRFGAYENDRAISVKCIDEEGEFGHFLEGEKVQLHHDEYGRLDILSIKTDLEKALGGQEVTSSIFAFQLMLAAQRAAFHRKEEK